MGEWSWNALKPFVYERANSCCEYGQTCEANSGQTMQVDHIDPQGGDVDEPSSHCCGAVALGGRRLSSTDNSTVEGRT
jgi:hypothetical protein